MSEDNIKKNKTFSLRLTKLELLHLRDLFSIVLPPDVSVTLSQSLAELENRQVIESFLWKKISNACEEAGLPLNEEAPDYIVAPTAAAPLKIFQLSSDMIEERAESEK